MKKIIIILCIAVLLVSLGLAVYAATNNQTSQADIPYGEKPPEEPPQMNGIKPSGPPDMIDFDAMVKKGVISQETCDRIKSYMEEHKPSDLPEMNSQPSRMNGNAPSDRPELPEMNGEGPAGGLLDDLLNSGIINQTEYDALSEAAAE